MELPGIKENKQKIKAITNVIEESKQYNNNNNSNSDQKKKEKVALDKKNNDSKQIIIEKPSKVLNINHKQSRITIEQGVNDGKSFHTEIETDRDYEDKEEVKILPSINIVNEPVIKEKESVEPAFKLDLRDMKAMNQNQN